MKNLPIEVSEEDIEDMFAAVDKNKDDKISYREFQKMINPPDIPQAAKPFVSQLGLKPQLFSPPSGKELCFNHQTQSRVLIMNGNTIEWQVQF